MRDADRVGSQRHHLMAQMVSAQRSQFSGTQTTHSKASNAARNDRRRRCDVVPTACSGPAGFAFRWRSPRVQTLL